MNISDIKRIFDANEQHTEEFKKGSIKGVLINVEDGIAEKVVMKNDLREFYRYCNCDLIDIVYRKVGDVKVNIVIDDEGLLRNDFVWSAANSKGFGVLAGNLLVFSGDTDDEGNLQSLTDDECDEILKSHVFARLDEGSNKIIPLLGHVDYV